MTYDEFVSEGIKVKQRLGVVQRLLAEKAGLTNRERKALDREQRILTRWLRNEPWGWMFDNPSWAREAELRIDKALSRTRQQRKARNKKERWVARKHPSWLSEAELQVRLWLMKHAEKRVD
jgi:hypothetical protein